MEEITLLLQGRDLPNPALSTSDQFPPALRKPKEPVVQQHDLVEMEDANDTVGQAKMRKVHFYI